MGLRDYLARSRHLLPVSTRAGSSARRAMVVVHGALVLWLFDLNDLAIVRWGGSRPAVWDPGLFGWTDALEQATSEIRAEYRRYVAAGGNLPQVAEIAGLVPGTPEAVDAAPVDRGIWRVLVLVANGAWIDEIAEHFPATRRALESCPQMTTVGFSVLGPGGHIGDHADPNRGARRYQLPLTVPGEAGECRIRVEDEVIEWVEGRSVVFNVATMHEAWNDADEDRVMMMVETVEPLPFPLLLLNRLVQHQYRFHPSHRAMPERVRALAAAPPPSLR